MDALFKQIRESASPAVWSKGVELARQDSVTGEEHGDEVKLRILTKTGVSPTVTLVPAEEDWHCTCGDDEDPCAHVAAAVIAWKRAREQGRPLPQSQKHAGRIAYLFKRAAQGLTFEREVINGNDVAPLTVALSAITSGRVSGPGLTATAEDLEVEIALGATRRGLLPAAVFPPLLKALKPPLTATLDGVTIVIDPRPVGLIAEARDDGPGVRVRIIQDPSITELFDNGAALCGDILRPVVLPQLTPTERQLLRDGQFFGVRELANLVAELLPALSLKMPVLSKGRNLPEKEEYLRPELELTTSRSGDHLHLRAAIIYGREPLARWRDGHFTILGERVPVRDQAIEAELCEKLRLNLGMDLHSEVVLGPAEAIRLVQRLHRFPGVIVGDAFDEFKVYATLVPSIVTDDGHEHATITFAVAGHTSGKVESKFADPARVVSAWQAGETLVPLFDGGFAPLPVGWLQQYGERLLDFLAARGDPAQPTPRLAWPLLAELANATDCPEEQLPKALVHFCAELKHGAKSLPVTAIPATLKAELRPYQQEGFRWLAWLKGLGLGALLADDMGLGKTVQTLSVLSGRTLIVAPTSVLFNWANEVRKFRPDLTICLYHGSNRELDPKADLIITTYALLRLDSDRLCAVDWDCLVFDEAHMLKNPDSQATKAARKVRAGFKLALSGTPVENRLEDLWSIMQLLNPGLLGDRRFFLDRYARPIQNGDSARAAGLRTRVAPFILRRRKVDVLPDLPSRTETVLYAELSTAERERYEIVRATTRRDILKQLESQSGGDGETRVNMIAALEALLRLRQAACHPDLLPGVTGEASAKLALLTETLINSSQNQHKTLVFSQWTRFLDLIEPALECAGIPFLRLDGSTVDRQAIVTAFQTENGPPVLLMSLKAGGVGLNLTAADHVIITDPWWNPAAEDQAADRAHRIGQERPVLIQRLVALDTVEERILKLQERKRSLALAALHGTEAKTTSITPQDLLALID
ncbi:MAG: DEAD/DEAH box helicase [Proteobacteria bacterium]|nr:DEAD/DEAH box helicase [Pseudomonadota bacterium]